METRVQLRYAQYSAGNGNPWTVAQDHAFQQPRDSFHAIYKKPPVALAFISALREQCEGACPICGSGGTGTLDHYLPKAVFPEFSFFSRNLIPACYKCNVQKSVSYIGASADERAIHPYFDVPAHQRLMAAAIDPPLGAPSFRAVAVDPPPAIADAIRWHLENIVMPAGFAKHCEHRWSRLVNAPRLHLGNTATAEAVRDSLRLTASQSADLDQSLNGWDSCFFYGVSESPMAIAHLHAVLTANLALDP